MENEEEKDQQVSYMTELAKHMGVSVSTLKDGWMFLFTEVMLKNLLQQAQKGNGMVALQVQSSACVQRIKN